MKPKLMLILICIGVLAACQTSTNERTPAAPGEIQTTPLETPLSSAILTLVPTKTSTETSVEIPLAATTFTPAPTEIPTRTPTEVAAEIDMNLAPIEVPSGNLPTIDGSLSPGEWDQAVVESFADGSQLFLMQTEEYLFLGIRAAEPGMIAGNVFIQRGDTISVHHASAALGTAIYQKDGDSWRQIQNFAWCCRSTSTSESAQAERDEFLQGEGWLAANGRMGTPNELEYQIRISEQNMRLTVVFTRSTYPYEKVPWPADLGDDCVKPTPGGFPATLEFSPERWGLLLLGSAE